VALDNVDEAAKVYEEYLQNREKPGGDFFIKEVFIGFARIHLMKKDFEKATTLFGFIDALTKSKKFKSTYNGFVLNDEMKNELKGKLGNEKFDRYWNEGSAMVIEDAVGYVLDLDHLTTLKDSSHSLI